jgi:virginiamycin A acetyltransferase
MVLKFLIVKLLYPFLFKGYTIQSYIGLRNARHIEPHVTIRRDVKIHGQTNISAFSLINAGTVMSPLLASIGRFTSIGPGVYLAPGNHNYNQTTSRGLPAVARHLGLALDKEINIRISTERETVQKLAKVGSDVWIGGRVTLLNGVVVGDGAVIASNSVVTKDVPPYSIVAGVPARVIKYRFDQEIISRLLEIDFYSKPLKEIEEFVKMNPLAMIDVRVFLECFPDKGENKSRES